MKTTIGYGVRRKLRKSCGNRKDRRAGTKHKGGRTAPTAPNPRARVQLAKKIREHLNPSPSKATIQTTTEIAAS